MFNNIIIFTSSDEMLNSINSSTQNVLIADYDDIMSSPTKLQLVYPMFMEHPVGLATDRFPFLEPTLMRVVRRLQENGIIGGSAIKRNAWSKSNNPLVLSMSRLESVFKLLGICLGAASGAFVAECFSYLIRVPCFERQSSFYAI